MAQKKLPPFDLETFLPYLLSVSADRTSLDLSRLYRDRFGISVAEWRVLVNVGYGDKLSIRDIERRVGLEKSKVSRAATRLETAGFLTKQVDDKDKRLLRLELTDRGADLLGQIVPIARDFQSALALKLKDPDLVITALRDIVGDGKN